MPVNQVFDYLPRKSDKTYELSFRIIRFPIGSNSYEIIITNLDRNIFDVKKIKEIYHFRPGLTGNTCFSIRLITSGGLRLRLLRRYSLQI